jgi:hypothetical protein
LFIAPFYQGALMMSRGPDGQHARDDMLRKKFGVTNTVETLEAPIVEN